MASQTHTQVHESLSSGSKDNYGTSVPKHSNALIVLLPIQYAMVAIVLLAKDIPTINNNPTIKHFHQY
jgi:hypothetical protein